jgi:hypothetical protein
MMWTLRVVLTSCIGEADADEKNVREIVYTTVVLSIWSMRWLSSRTAAIR